MADEFNNNENIPEISDERPQDAQSVSAQPDNSAAPKKGNRKSKGKQKKGDKRGGKKSRAQKEWEDSLVSNKRVKREENRRKLKKAMLLLLTFSIIVTSVVYVMILFVQENSVRITANSGDPTKSISLSIDGIDWTPYLDAAGPEFMRDISYDHRYRREPVPHKEDALALVKQQSPIGNLRGENYIAFGFILRNTSSASVDLPLRLGIDMKTDNMQLETAIRVMWAESYSQQPEKTACDVFAAYSADDRLAALNINEGRKKGEYIEMAAYPYGSDQKDAEGNDFDLAKYDEEIDLKYPGDENPDGRNQTGFFPTVPFLSSDKVMERETTLRAGEMIYVYLSVWIEGSDFDCTDDKLGGFVSLTVNFSVA